MKSVPKPCACYSILRVSRSMARVSDRALSRVENRILAETAPLWNSLQCTVIDRFGRSAWRDLVAELDRLMAYLPSESTEQA